MAGCVPTEQIDLSCCADWPSYTVEVQDRALSLAWGAMRALSGGRVGNCPVVMRPCLTVPCGACSDWYPRIVDGTWQNMVCGSSGCSCPPLSQIAFPGEVASVDEVMVDGQVLAEDQYRLDNQHLLVRTDGLAWPSCQDMSLGTDQLGTMSVTYMPGIVLDSGGAWAVGQLACEFAKACAPSVTGTKCRLPSTVSSLARQGTSLTLVTGMFPAGLTGITETDAYLKAINPNQMFRPPSVWSPDLQAAGHHLVGYL